MSQYIAVEVSPSETYLFNALTIVNDLIFAYILHKISKRVPIPYQINSRDDHDIAASHMKSNNLNPLQLQPLNINDVKTSYISEEIIVMNLHDNKCINRFCKCQYKLIAPTYPPYFFDDISPDKQKELLESHWKTIQEQTQTPTVQNSGGRDSFNYASINKPHQDKKGVFAITAKKATGLVFKRNACWQYLSLTLRLWCVIYGIIALALTWSFWMNVLLEYCIACAFSADTSTILGLICIFFIIHCGLWWLKRQWQSLKLLWYNVCDEFNVMAVVVWRSINFLLCLIFTLISSLNSNFSVSDSIFWQLFLRWMVVEGLVWELGYCVVCFLVNIWVVFQLYLKRYNFAFLTKLGQSNLNYIRKQKKKWISNLFATQSANSPNAASPQKLVTPTVPEEEFEEKKDNEEPHGLFSAAQLLSQHDTNELKEFDALEQTQQNLVLAMERSRAMAKTKWVTFLEVLCALKDNENREVTTCKIKKIYIKYCYVFMLFVSMTVLFAVGENVDNRDMCTFAGWMFFMYYFIVLFRRGKYNALYCFWSSKYHQRFYSNLQIIHHFQKQKRAETQSLVVDDMKPITVGDDDDEKKNKIKIVSSGNKINDDYQHSIGNGIAANSLLSPDTTGSPDNEINAQNSDDVGSGYIALTDQKQNNNNAQQQQKIHIRRQSSTDGREILLYKDRNTSRYIETFSIDYMDFWSMIELDDNDFYGCNVFCGATKELCGALCVFIVIIVFVALAIRFSDSGNSPTRSVYAENTDQIQSPYPICQVSWARDYLNLLDLVFLTLAAYYSDRAQIKTQFDLWFGNKTYGNLTGTGWNFTGIYVQDIKPAFFHISNDIGLEVVAIRGTYSMDDVLQDVSLYTEVATLQTFSWVIPLTTILPTGFIRDFVKYASIPEGIIDPDLRDRYDQPIYDYVEANLSSELSKQSNNNIHHDLNKTVLVLGHSLGGGVAEIVAAKFADEGYTNIYSFGLSSPGTLWSSKKFGFSVEALDKSSISVLPRRDPVSSVDKHGGVAQIIECDAEESPLCHLATRSFCEIFQECGPSLARNLSFVLCVCGNSTQSANDWEACW